MFATEQDYQRYISDLRELKDVFGGKVYAYCLMTKHVHTLLAPDKTIVGLGQLIKALAARATRFRNRLEGRTGTRESRYKSSVVESDACLLACCRCIELNPARARMVAKAGDYPWSSYRMRVTDQSDSDWLDMDPCFIALGDMPEERRTRYMEFMRQKAVPPSEIDLIRAALQRGQLTGSARFVDEIERIQGPRVELHGQGRPRHHSEE